ncbi:flagellar biosynthesis anti-sigma factor FlgM [Hydrogenophaga sp. PBL-H3]|uniref:flagellar biosynthesis anti-sigma factor FlgM n=1 Tax=Hydrogenophaga sp. PBL-H3 TaxID=434010 RepID=UPI0013201DDF|nr:flagellar biosynthesis anti-sigma factor FlgM [Hydrogenophaga sp. PBL-H3]QHE77636.1 flagellar biosynthesis anti-sigma factor FlgM [Hydrogenophaga sp. PBL-H3]QHE82060.1 flagellar biosynthesis anti-sigma factor FlgM [Hydrogenophaga sp. PBL-H3]
MKVDSSPDSYIGSVAGGPQKATAPAAAEASAAASVASAGQAQPGVTVTLSASTTEARSVSGGDVFNADKVASMKAAIANGSFQVNAEAIADKMLANAAEMLGGTRT